MKSGTGEGLSRRKFLRDSALSIPVLPGLIRSLGKEQPRQPDLNAIIAKAVSGFRSVMGGPRKAVCLATGKLDGVSDASVRFDEQLKWGQPAQFEMWQLSGNNSKLGHYLMLAAGDELLDGMATGRQLVRLSYSMPNPSQNSICHSTTDARFEHGNTVVDYRFSGPEPDVRKFPGFDPSPVVIDALNYATRAVAVVHDKNSPGLIDPWLRLDAQVRAA